MDDAAFPAEQGVVRLSDGRVLAWSAWGPLDGRPVLYCPGAGMSGSAGFALGDLDGLGVRLIAIDRPGLGRSTFDPDKTLVSWAADVGALVADLRLERPLSVGFSQGAVFALTLGGLGIVEAIAVVSGQDDLRSMRASLHPDVARMIADRDADPDGFERYLSGMADADGMWQLIIGTSSEHDRRHYESDALGPALRRAVDDGFAQGAAGYARDLAIALGPWPVAAEEIGVPVDLWYGPLDSSIVHSPDHGRTLAGRLPDACLHLVDDEGGSLLWTLGPAILADLLDRAPARD